MSNAIPPLLCSTPPPIDFGDGNEHDDDFGAFESADTEYGQFDGPSLPTTPKYSVSKDKKPVDLPVPEYPPFQTEATIDIPKDDPIPSSTEKIKSPTSEPAVTVEDVVEPEIHRNNIDSSELAPDSIENFKISYIEDPIQFVINEPSPIDVGYSSESQSPKNSRGESPQSLEFSPGNLSDDDSIGEFQVNETKYDDNTSLPSLKFDAIDIAKSDTPVIEDKTIVNKSPVAEQLTIVDEKSTISAFETEKLADEENVWVENEFQSHEEDRPAIADEVENIANTIEKDEEEISKNEVNCDIELNFKPDLPEMNPTKSLSVENLACERQEISESLSPPELQPDDNLSDDDFSFQEFGGISESETIKDDPPFTIEDNAFGTNDPDEIMFEADFSQIDAFATESNPVLDNGAENSELKESSDQFKSEDNFEESSDQFKSADNFQESSDQFKSADNFERVDDDFEDFQDFSTAKQAEIETENNEAVNVDDDDDFGDFNDFQDTTSFDAAGAASNETQSIINLPQINDKLKTVLEMMFPDEENRTNSEQFDDKNSLNEINSNLTSNLRELDSAKALEYQWPNSSMKHSLVKALGIDSRNILYGEKWNSSMPRFAANLGFNPLEPLKPMKLLTSSDLASSSSSSQSSTITTTSKIPSNMTIPTDVPAVKFDWNSSGLVNPLDGVKEILHEGKTEKIHQTKSNVTDESSEPASKDKSSTAIVETPRFITPLPDVHNDLKQVNQIDVTAGENTIENYSHKVELDSNHIRPSSCNTFVVPLKETHIYTPSKSENSVSRSVKAGEKCPIDFDYEMAAIGIVINEQVVKKEYRDIVYNPEAQIDTASSQVLEPSSIAPGSDDNVAVVDPNKHFRQKSTDTLGAFSLSAQTLNIIENTLSKRTDEIADDFNDFQQNITTFDQLPTIMPISNLPIADKYSALKNTEINMKCDAKLIPETPQKSNSFDDEFSDFQSVAPAPVVPVVQKTINDLKPKSRTETPTLSDAMILSPAILLPQAIKIENTEPQINWPGDPGINPDELARLEQLFPQVKNIVNSSPTITTNPIKSNSNSTANEDDDWSDFVSVPANLNTTNQMLQAPTPPITLSTISKTYDDDDWSDFVSSTPAPTTTTKAPWSLTQMPPPQFNSWNQPNLFTTLPNQSASHQGLYSTSHQQFQKTNSTTIVPTTTKTFYQKNNNQFLINGHLKPTAANHLQQQNDISQMKVLSQQQQYQQQQSQRNQTVLRSQLNMSPSISLIPDLGFAAPKSFVNVPRTNFSKK